MDKRKQNHVIKLQCSGYTHDCFVERRWWLSVGRHLWPSTASSEWWRQRYQAANNYSLWLPQRPVMHACTAS